MRIKIKKKEYLYLEDIFGLCKAFKKVTKNLGFHLVFKINDLQNIIYSSMADDIKVTFKNLYLYLANLIPNVETQVMFNEDTQNNYSISYDEYYTERRVISDMILKADIGSFQQFNSPRYLIGAHQARARADTVNKIKILLYLIILFFENFTLK